MRVAVVAGSDLSHELDLEQFIGGCLIVAVDSGAEALMRVGVVPDLFVGDMDSVGAETRSRLRNERVETVVLPVAKDETDLEHALSLVVDRGAEDVRVFGALGGPRLDHLLGNVLLLASPWLEGVHVRLVDGMHEVMMVHGDLEVSGRPGDLVSLLPLTAEVEGVRTDGLLYALAGETLVRSSTRSLSNEMTGTRSSVMHGAGALLLVHHLRRRA